jgi:hypothetical protein
VTGTHSPRIRRPRPTPQLWVGVFAMVAIEVLLAAGNRFVATWLTPLMWSAYIAFADGLVSRLRGRSWLADRRREFPLLVLASVGIWLVFEAYNLRLRNWVYFNVPADPFVRDIAYFWSFATIIPGVFETSELILALLERLNDRTPRGTSDLRTSRPTSPLWFIAGLAMVALPAVAPYSIAPYLFAPVWIGFFFLVDPLNRMLSSVSLADLFRAGRRLPLYALLIGGGICGLFWEAWNLQASLAGGGHWVYTIPQALRVFNLHYGKMPVLGLLGFPPFALELFACYIFLRQVLGGDRVWHPSRDKTSFSRWADKPGD